MDDNKTTTPLRSIAGAATIVFGLPANDPVLLSLNPSGGAMIQGDSRSVTAQLLARAEISRAICALFPVQQDGHNDAVAVIDALLQVGFRGEMLVLAPPLLRPKMVENELRGLARGITLRLLAGHLPPLTDI